jgi:predicted small secreted protein
MMTASITEVDSASGRKVGFDPMVNHRVCAMIILSRGHMATATHHNKRKQMKNTIKRLIPLILISAFWAALCSSCNTMRGAGRDVEKTGENIQKATH